MIFPLPVVIFTTLLPISLCATTTTVSTSQQGPVVSSDYTDSMAFRNAVLNGTNTYRRQHNATALKWNETLAEYAEKWSDRCFFNHSEGPYGENLASGYPNGTASIAAWGDERQSYSFSSGEFSKKTGHFTQLVWKATTSVGCSRTNCTAKGDGTAPGWYVICEYWPRGNVIGQFADNVQSRVKDPDPAGKPGDEPDGDKGGDGEEGSKEGDEKKCPQGGVCSNARGNMDSCMRMLLLLCAIFATLGVY